MINKYNRFRNIVNMLDYIIVGQGIAGSVIAYSLLKRNKKFMVIDEDADSSSSKVAAGLYNPVVFKRLVKSWKADELIPFADTFYSDAEKDLEKRFYFKKKIIKIFSDEEEINFWRKKSKEEVEEYLSGEIKKDFFPNEVNNPLGCAEVLNSGYLNVLAFLSAIKEELISRNFYQNEIFDHSNLQIQREIVIYKGINAKHIIFCEGYKAIHNPFFPELNFKLTKGELLTVHIPNFNVDEVINKGVFILPLGNNIFKVGATYEWNEINEQTTDKGKEELVEKLKKVITDPFEIIEHKAGIRPTVNDRRPIIGLHPDNSSLAIFNGMGTKGVMLAPYFADQLINHIEEGLPLDKEADVKRFYKK